MHLIELLFKKLFMLLRGDTPDRRRGSFALVAAVTVQVLLTVCTSARTISFSGLTWVVRSGGGNPGNGCWSDDPASVWVDASGNLHLKIRQLLDGSWCQAEVDALNTYADYGDHLFWTNSRLDLLDPNVIFSGYLRADDNHEIDIEITRSFDADPTHDLWYTVQPYSPGAPKATHPSPLVLTGSNGDSYSSYDFVWSGNGSVSFASWYGHCLTAPCGGLIATWPYSGANTPASCWHLIPTINLWINHNATPTAPQEVIVAAYRGPQLPTVQVSSPNGGETWAVGSPHTVTWTTSAALNPAGQLYILLSQDGGQTEYPTPIAVLSPGVTSYTWTPMPAHATSTARLGVGNLVDCAYEAFDWSDQNFTVSNISAQPPTVTTGTVSNITQTRWTALITVPDVAAPVKLPVGKPARSRTAITELRSFLDAARGTLGLSTDGYTNPSIVGAAIKAIDSQELRDRVK
jgi:hypothetical protein